MAEQTAQAEARVRVWDPVVRVGHWVLVAGFATAYLTEGEPEWLHVWAGYAIAATVTLRIFWGLVGPERARFSDFVTGPGKVVAYLKRLVAGSAERHIGHSPAGGAMTVALLVMLGATAFSGMAVLAEEEGEGPLAGLIAQSESGGEGGVASYERQEHEEREGHAGGETAWEDIHETAANLSVLLILLHVGGVAWASMVHRENLAHAMITGDKRA
ncbi:Cytochrome b [Rhodovulum sp. ES.010]|uniref:cytochrome b/b6 domain-containing protein n=1 Tax=Rhodovulum sp. ES.010 TaxID=1882821 RepID=UPI00092CCDC1|nr:cytochrome b/b6 domain-containing protein [Rhodovulum sp. ES.010]SIO47690.1 Cytochrome b [Rhodovulum sp. ES.010]SIO53194.1 Cytochrome b [Rhodovulum sp. ES.010]